MGQPLDPALGQKQFTLPRRWSFASLATVTMCCDHTYGSSTGFLAAICAPHLQGTVAGHSLGISPSIVRAAYSSRSRKFSCSTSNGDFSHIRYVVLVEPLTVTSYPACLLLEPYENELTESLYDPGPHDNQLPRDFLRRLGYCSFSSKAADPRTDLHRSMILTTNRANVMAHFF